jgi:hypothetical protein
MQCDMQTQSEKIKKPQIKRSKFSREEDEEIHRLVCEHGTGDWDLIAQAMGKGRTKRQVRERWQSYLSPELDCHYTEKEDRLLQSLYHRLGPKWSMIAVALRQKSGISVRNRYRTIETLKAKGFKPHYERQSATHQELKSGEMEVDRTDLLTTSQMGMLDVDGAFDGLGLGLWDSDVTNFM